MRPFAACTSSLEQNELKGMLKTNIVGSLLLAINIASAAIAYAAVPEQTTATEIDPVTPFTTATLIEMPYSVEGGNGTNISLDDAIKYALENNHNLASSRISVAAAIKGAEVAWRDRLPKINLEASGSWQANNFHSYSTQVADGNDLHRFLGFSLTQPLYDFGYRNNLIDVEKARVSVEQQAVYIAEQQLVAEVINAYYIYNLKLGELQIRQNELLFAQELHRQSLIQYEAGTVPHLDIIRALAKVEDALANCIDAEAALVNAAAHFRSLLGADKRFTPEPLSAPLIDIGPEPVDLDEAIGIALANRPELRMQRGIIMKGELAGSLKLNRPVIDAEFGAQYSVPASSGGTDNYQYGIRLRWPVYSGGKDRAAKKQAELEVQSLKQDIIDLETQIELEVTTAWNRLIAARSRTESTARHLELATEAHRAAMVGYASGVTSYTDYINAIDSRVAAAINHVTSLINVKLAQSELTRATAFSNGYPDDSRQDSNPAVSVLDVLGLAQSVTLEPESNVEEE